ncbi:MAG: hemerythrin [Terriglobia bacterium]|nr:MAG: hemerythrin [Terriglobia bacterium]
MFEWKDCYRVQINSIDGQHQNLFRLAANLHAALQAGQSQAIMTQLLDRLLQYTQVHFAQEERLMQNAKYPEFAAHKAQHEEFIAEVVRLQKEFKDGRMAISLTMLQFLKRWLAKHIMQSDQKYAPYLKAKAVA